MEIFGHIPTQLILLFVIYGITGAVPLIAALYLLLRRGNAFAPDVTPPLRLRRWTASLFAATSLSHVWWMLFLIYSREIYSVGYVLAVMFDCAALLITIAGTLLSMLQDRRRPVWPALVALIPFAALCGMFIVHPNEQFKQAAVAYVLLLFVIFTTYMVFAVRRYGRWLNDNYADLENKKVWLSQTVTLGCMLLFLLYALVVDLVLLFFMHAFELVLFGLLLWRVETLPQLDTISTEACTAPVPEAAEATDVPQAAEATDVSQAAEATDVPQKDEATDVPQTDEATDVPKTAQVNPPREHQLTAPPINIDLAQIERLLAEHCMATQLYLQHDLTLHQLALAVGTNRSYLSLYFSRQGITYNTYINNLRINHFISRCQEATAAGQSVIAQQLAQESGFRSYSTFGRAFMQRTGQSVTAWLRITNPGI